MAALLGFCLTVDDQECKIQIPVNVADNKNKGSGLKMHTALETQNYICFGILRIWVNETLLRACSFSG